MKDTVREFEISLISEEFCHGDDDDGLLRTSEETIPMTSDDWKPLADAMAALEKNPRCGDIAKKFHEIFTKAMEGNAYQIELIYGDDDNTYFQTIEFDPYPGEDDE